MTQPVEVEWEFDALALHVLALPEFKLLTFPSFVLYRSKRHGQADPRW